MKVLPTIEDFPTDKASCGNCTRRGGACDRSQRQKYPNGYVKNSSTGELSGIIYCCPHYTGIHQKQPLTISHVKNNSVK